MRLKQEKELENSIQLGPMIDCMMILLMYFIIAGRIDVEEKYLGLMLPGGATMEKKEALITEIVVSINEAGQVFCNNQPLGNPDDTDLAMVRSKLDQALKLFGDKQPVVIHPEPKVRQQRIADVLSACAAAGVKNLSFNANPQ
ncbi:MAG: biopolymer transporter ExbD [Kiritimatiellia bacterium]|jgi:biopolymer transport protein ExbD